MFENKSKLIVTVFFQLLLLSQITQVAAQGRSAEALARAAEVKEKHVQDLMERFGVVGVGIGFDQQGEVAIKVFVETQAETANLPQSLDGVPLVAKVTGKIVAMDCLKDSNQWDPTARCDRPVPIGVSTGHPNVTAGTIGARVKDSSGNVYALSNNHVYAAENQANEGLDPVYQPGVFDGGLSENTIGTLHDFEPIRFCTPFLVFWLCSQTNTLDAAIAISSSANLGNSTPPYGYGIPRSTIFGDNNGDGSFDNINDLLNLPVQKCGRTTGCTTGRITAVNTTIDVGYGAGLARFVNQIIVESDVVFIGGGDSGSSLVDQNRYPVGLLFAGGNGGLMAVANRIDLVLNRFGVTVDGEAAPPPPPDTLGPLTSSVNVSPNPTAGATSVNLSAAVNDSSTGGSAVAAAEYFINSVGDYGTGTPMNASDGAFNSMSEGVTASINVSPYIGQTITLYVRGRDSKNNWGAVSSVALNVTAAPLAFDGFEGGWSGGNGWAGAWTRSGDASIVTSGGSYAGSYHLRLRRSTGYAARSVNLGSSGAYLSFCAKVNSFESSDKAEVKINGAVVKTFTNATQSNNTYACYNGSSSIPLPSGTVTIAFDAGMSNQDDYWYIDNIEVKRTP